jgi:hypothetical protein
MLRVQQRRHHDHLPDPEARLADADPRLPNRDEVGQRVVRIPVQRPDRRRLGPANEVIVGTQPLPAAEVRPTVERVQAADQLDAALTQKHDGRPVAEQAVSQEDVPGRSTFHSRRSKLTSPCPLPAYWQNPTFTTAPHAKEISAPMRAIGNPSPGFWL